MSAVITFKAEKQRGALFCFLLLQDLMSDDDEGECEAGAQERHHQAEQTPLVLHGERQVLKESEERYEAVKLRSVTH